MSQVVVFLLLVLGLVFPVVGTIMLRLFRHRLSEKHMLSGIVAIFTIAIISVLVLARSNVHSLSIGNLTLLLPITRPVTREAQNIPPPEPMTNSVPLLSPLSSIITATSITSATIPVITTTTAISLESTHVASTTITRPLPRTQEMTINPTLMPTLTITPTSIPTQASPPLSPTEPPTPELPPAQRQTYTVQAGDTIRSIAEKFGIEVPALLNANNMTPADADHIYPGEELIIP